MTRYRPPAPKKSAYITPDGKANETVTPLYTVRDGVIVIPKNTVIPPGTRI